MAWHKQNSIKNFPFVKILPALAAGIWLQWHNHFSLTLISSAAIIFALLFCIVSFLPTAKRFLFSAVHGATLMLLVLCTGMLLTYFADIRNNNYWYQKNYKDGQAVLVTVAEPLNEKQKSWKALANAEALLDSSGHFQKVTGKILLYFKKDSAIPSLQYGSQIIITKPLQPIKNNGNPGALNYTRVCLFGGITHQCFLSDKDYIILPQKNSNPFQKFIFSVRDASLIIIKKYVPGDKEQGLAEALLIGYRNDLDRDLVQAYSNTGVVHIIAISGLHIGLIYGLLLYIFSFFKRRKIPAWIKAISIIFILWMFTLVAGAAPSILRATVMFTFLIIGDSLKQKANPYNSLASSAFLLLAFNPFFLWDVGFQLSYAALFGIIAFHKNMYTLFFFKNKLLNAFWNLNAVTLSAQLFTLPIVLYHFHQLPTMFLFTNVIAVPLSFLVLYAELLLLCVAWWPWLAKLTGIVCYYFILAMNSFVEYVDALPFSVIDGIKINRVQTITLLVFIICLSIWLLHKNTRWLVYALSSLTVFLLIRTNDIWAKTNNNKLIVYNVPKHAAMDFVSGRNFFYAGDTAVINDDFLRNFNLKYGRVKMRMYHNQQAAVTGLDNSVINYNENKILFLSSNLNNYLPAQKINVDIIIVSNNPKISIDKLHKVFNFHQIIFDSSNPFWKTSEWKKDCKALHLRSHSVTDDGAFITSF